MFSQTPSSCPRCQTKGSLRSLKNGQHKSTIIVTLYGECCDDDCYYTLYIDNLIVINVRMMELEGVRANLVLQTTRILHFGKKEKSPSKGQLPCMHSSLTVACSDIPAVVGSKMLLLTPYA